jgi:ribosomal 50S subunit-recycling heat shock protein
VKSASLIVAIVVLAAGFAFPAYSEDKKEDVRPGGVVIEVRSVTATVESIDYNARTVTLRGPVGDLVSLKVGEEAKNFNRVKKGDKVTFDYYESIAIDIKKYTGEPRAEETQSVTRAKPGEKPITRIETTGHVTARVEDVDYQSRMITLRMAQGGTMSLKAGDQVKNFSEIKKGDEVFVRYIQATEISFHTP